MSNTFGKCLMDFHEEINKLCEKQISLDKDELKVK